MARRLRKKEIVEEEDDFREAIPASGSAVWVESDVTSRPMIAAIVTWLVTALEVLLLLRLLLRLGGASPSNGFVSAVYDLSRPFVAPFLSATGIEVNTGIGSFETATIIAMLVYGLIVYLVVAAITSFTRDRH